MAKKEEIKIPAVEPVSSGINAMKISQSMMKEVRGYLDGQGCGIVLRARWIEGKKLGEPSAAMKLGMYFEYILTGAKPKDGKVPQPEFMKSAVAKNKGSVAGLGIDAMYEPYRAAHANADHVKEIWGQMGLQIYNPLNSGLQAGIYLADDEFEGTIDVFLEAFRDVKFESGFVLEKGDVIWVDLKYSGMLDDKWSVHGWQWTPDQKKYHGTQAKQYKHLAKREGAFNVVDPGGKYVKFFHPIIDRDTIERHKDEGRSLKKRLIELHELDLLEPRPEFNKCQECPLMATCEYAHRFPHPVDVDLRTE